MYKHISICIENDHCTFIRSIDFNESKCKYIFFVFRVIILLICNTICLLENIEKLNKKRTRIRESTTSGHFKNVRSVDKNFSNWHQVSMRYYLK